MIILVCIYFIKISISVVSLLNNITSVDCDALLESLKSDHILLCTFALSPFLKERRVRPTGQYHVEAVLLGFRQDQQVHVVLFADDTTMKQFVRRLVGNLERVTRH